MAIDWRDWAGSVEDTSALARLTSKQYPDSPITSADVARSLELTNPHRPFLVRFAVQDDQEIAFVESYPLDSGVFLLELVAPASLCLGLFNYAEAWARAQQAQKMEITVVATDERLNWLMAQGFQVMTDISEWKWQGQRKLTVPSPITFVQVGEHIEQQEQLRQLINLGRAELGLPAMNPIDFADNVLHLGQYQPKLLWLALGESGQAIGAVTLHSWETGQHAEVQWLSVLPDFRRQGIGSALLFHATQFAQDSGIEQITISLGESASHLAPLLRKAGFYPQATWLTLQKPLL